jgi:hypothetical protein
MFAPGTNGMFENCVMEPEELISSKTGGKTRANSQKILSASRKRKAQIRFFYVFDKFVPLATLLEYSMYIFCIFTFQKHAKSCTNFWKL